VRKLNFTNAVFGSGMSFLLSGALLVSAVQAQEAEPGSIEDLSTTQPQQQEVSPAKVSLTEEKSFEEDLSTTQPQQQETLPTKVSLTEEKGFQGIIVDAQGEPVSGTLNMLLEGRSVHTTETDSSGVFMIANVEPGIYQLASVSQDLVGNQSVDLSYQTGEAYLPQAEVVVHPISDGATVEGFCNECATGCNECGTGIAQEEIVYARSCGCSGGGFVGGGGNSFATSGSGRLFSGASGGRLLSRPGRLLLFGGIATAIAVGSSDDDDDTTPATPGS